MKSVNKRLDNLVDEAQTESLEQVHLINLYIDQAQSLVND